MKLLPIGNGNVFEIKVGIRNPSGDTRNQQLMSVVNDCIQLIYTSTLNSLYKSLTVTAMIREATITS